MDSSEAAVLNQHVEALRETDYPTLQDCVYLDHAGTTPISKSLIESFSKDLVTDLYGNPHSASPSSQRSTHRVDNVRLAALRLFNADPQHFDLVFVQNATAAIKLVQEACRSCPGGFWYGYHADAHTSLVGVREAASADHRCFASDDEVERWLESTPSPPLTQKHVSNAPGAFSTASSDCSASNESLIGSETSDAMLGCPMLRTSDTGVPLELFAYPAQSNMNGRRLPLSWSHRVRSARPNCYTLLDVASLVSTSPLDLSNAALAPDFCVLSFYKMFGFPDLGALIVRKPAAHVFRRRRYFGGGTVDMATVLAEQWHAPKSSSLHASLEDGTLPFHNIIALGWAIKDHKEKFGSFASISAHTEHLAKRLYHTLSSLRHYNQSPVCEIYNRPKDWDASRQGPIIALNFRASNGSYYSTYEVEKVASLRNIHIRSGGICNPGGTAKALHLAPWELRENFSAGWRCGTEDDIVNGKPSGMLRVSLGATSTMRDTKAFQAFVKEFFVERHGAAEESRPTASSHDYEMVIQQLFVYPIKSCAAWTVPSGQEWEVRTQGLAWDREWCLMHEGTGEILSQKQYPRMACVRPVLDTASGLLRVRYEGPRAQHAPCGPELVVPLSADPSLFDDREQAVRTSSRSLTVCGVAVSARVYSSRHISQWFSQVLEVPCQLARFPVGGSFASARHAKPHPARAAGNQNPPMPLLLSNESPLLAVTQRSLNKLNREISKRKPQYGSIPASAFRPNIVLSDAEPPSATSTAYIEDTWASLNVISRGSHKQATFEVLGPCRRCQMVCIDQKTAERREEPFLTLAKTRKSGGKVWFGVHMGLQRQSATAKTRPRQADVFAIRIGDGAIPKSVPTTET